MSRKILCSAMIVLGWFGPLVAGEITGSVQIWIKGKEERPIEEPVVVYVDDLVKKFPPAFLSKRYAMETRDKQFIPRLMVVPVGTKVIFTNFDPILHNVFSVSGGNQFDGGLFHKGDAAEQTFKEPGLVRVYCNVHHSMSALIQVASNPYYTQTDDWGRFKLEGIPDGTYKVAVYHRLAGRESQMVTVTNGRADALTFELKARRKRVKKHLDKDGKPYKRRGSERY